MREKERVPADSRGERVCVFAPYFDGCNGRLCLCVLYFAYYCTLIPDSQHTPTGTDGRGGENGYTKYCKSREKTVKSEGLSSHLFTSLSMTYDNFPDD